MAEPVVVLACLAQDFDAATGVCAAPFYSVPPGALPTLTLLEAQEIGMACATLLAAAWVIKQCARALNGIG